MKSIYVIIITGLWLLGLIIFDIYLWNDDVEGNTITQLVWYYSQKSHFVPFLIGATFGGLTIHFFERK